HIHDAEVLLGEFRIVRGEPRMEPRTGIGVGIDAGIIGRERLHLVEAVLDWIRFRFVAEMPFAREVRRVAVLLEELRNSGCLLAEGVLVARGDHNRQGWTDGAAPGDKRRGPGCATRPPE